jgi:hypothetical protein
MYEFKQYRRKAIAEMRPYVPGEDLSGVPGEPPATSGRVSISDADIANGSPKLGDMIARNPANHYDRWLVAAKFAEDNFTPLEE